MRLRETSPRLGEDPGAADRAQEEGWYRRAIDDALQLVTHRMTAFFEEEADYMRPPGGERI